MKLEKMKLDISLMRELMKSAEEYWPKANPEDEEEKDENHSYELGGDENV